MKNIRQHPPIIHSSRLRLSEFTMADAADVYNCITPAITRYIFWDPPPSFEAYKTRREQTLLSTDRNDYSFVIRRRDTMECLGIASLDNLDADEPELGLWLKETVHGNGYGTEVVRAVADWAVRALDKKRFTYAVATENIPSRRIAESLGGEVIGTRTRPKYDSVVYHIAWPPTVFEREPSALTTEYERYSDRQLSSDDAAYVVALHRLSHAVPFIHCPTEARIAELATEPSMRARVILDSVGKPAGFIAMSNHDGWLVEIHGMVAERPRSGAGRWALREALRWAFDDLGANRVWLEVTAANVNARRLYEDVGFVHEGTYRLGYRSSSGEYEDLAHYGILAREWIPRAAES